MLLGGRQNAAAGGNEHSRPKLPVPGPARCTRPSPCLCSRWACHRPGLAVGVGTGALSSRHHGPRPRGGRPSGRGCESCDARRSQGQRALPALPASLGSLSLSRPGPDPAPAVPPTPSGEPPSHQPSPHLALCMSLGPQASLCEAPLRAAQHTGAHACVPFPLPPREALPSPAFLPSSLWL